jgi:hypothetical protein
MALDSYLQVVRPLISISSSSVDDEVAQFSVARSQPNHRGEIKAFVASDCCTGFPGPYYKQRLTAT